MVPGCRDSLFALGAALTGEMLISLLQFPDGVVEVKFTVICRYTCIEGGISRLSCVGSYARGGSKQQAKRAVGCCFLLFFSDIEFVGAKLVRSCSSVLCSSFLN